MVTIEELEKEGIAYRKTHLTNTGQWVLLGFTLFVTASFFMYLYRFILQNESVALYDIIIEIGFMFAVMQFWYMSIDSAIYPLWTDYKDIRAVRRTFKSGMEVDFMTIPKRDKRKTRLEDKDFTRDSEVMEIG